MSLLMSLKEADRRWRCMGSHPIISHLVGTDCPPITWKLDLWKRRSHMHLYFRPHSPLLESLKKTNTPIQVGIQYIIGKKSGDVAYHIYVMYFAQHLKLCEELLTFIRLHLFNRYFLQQQIVLPSLRV